MISHLDGAKIIKLSVKGDYGTIKIQDYKEAKIPVCFLAICKYDGDDKYHLFDCDNELNVVDDDLCDDLDEAVNLAQIWSDLPIKWEIDKSG
ncbi:MAG: hypothetical protein FWD39_00500 [Clostridiales bacterium]|nr:hypothetical protein [Clostridiales bacterium]